MSRFVPVRALSVVLSVLVLINVAQADNEGQPQLDDATELKVVAKSLKDLDKVVQLCEEAIRKGLDDENKSFAKNLITSTLFQQASVHTAGIFQSRGKDWQFQRHQALSALTELLDFDSKFVDAHLLIARLETLPNGNRRRGLKAVERAIDLLKDNKEKQSLALVTKAQFVEGEEERMKILAKAIEVDPKNARAYQLRALLRFAKGDAQQAIEDMKKVLEQDPENAQARLAVAEALVNLKQYDEAMKQIDKVLEQDADAANAHMMRARVYIAQEKLKEAREALGKALDVNTDDVAALLMRARVHLAEDHAEKAMDDVNRILSIRPLVQALLLRSMIHADQQNFDDAIADLKLLVDSTPGNAELQLQLAAYYNASGRPRQAIRIYNRVLNDDEDSWQAHRGRADASLSIGKHAEAVEDYKIAVKQQPEHSGILNNYAWVLATSPKDDVRDAKRAIELAKKACEVTEYKAPHILSTLGAAYAESGDFESAIKWSTKAVELGEDDMKEALQKELNSYKEKKPWREIQDTKEKPAPAARNRRLAA